MPPATHGRFHWNELMTWNVEGAKAFYAETLGWTYDSHPMPEGVYTLCKADGAEVAGMMEMTPGARFDGVPDHWFAYIEVDDVDARTARAADAGGEVLRPAFDVPGVGRIAIVKDGAGAAVGLISPAPEG